MQTQVLCKANIIASLAYCYFTHKNQSGDWPVHVLGKQLRCCAQHCHIKTVNQDLEYYMPLF